MKYRCVTCKQIIPSVREEKWELLDRPQCGGRKIGRVAVAGTGLGITDYWSGCTVQHGAVIAEIHLKEGCTDPACPEFWLNFLDSGPGTGIRSHNSTRRNDVPPSGELELEKEYDRLPTGGKDCGPVLTYHTFRGVKSP